MTVAMLLSIISGLASLGTLAKNIIDIRTELETQPLQMPAQPVHIAAVKDAIAQGSVWDEDHNGN